MKKFNVIGIVMTILFPIMLVVTIKRSASEKHRPTGRRERVELITWRTELPHVSCPSNGAWQVSGQPRQITAYGIDKAVWPHRCAGCGATNEIYDATWPKFEREWRSVK